MEMQLSNQAVGAIMMLLQKSILSIATGNGEVDITEILREFKIRNTEDGLVITNPPVVMMAGLSDLMEANLTSSPTDDTHKMT
jgi:hypothetical protein